MRISFDLDQTLLTFKNEFPTEPQNLFQKVLRFEKLRLGTVGLMQQIQLQDHEVWIYTSSQRPKHYINELFLRHEIKLDGILNRKYHISGVALERRALKKYPPAFDIDIHIDDSIGVMLDGEVFGFKTILVQPDEINWVKKIEKEIGLSSE